MNQLLTIFYAKVTTIAIRDLTRGKHMDKDDLTMKDKACTNGCPMKKLRHSSELVSKTYKLFFEIWRFEVYIHWNRTFLKLKYLFWALLPRFETYKQRYGRDVYFGWLGGTVEISYTNKTVSDNTGVQEEIPND